MRAGSSVTGTRAPPAESRFQALQHAGRFGADSPVISFGAFDRRRSRAGPARRGGRGLPPGQPRAVLGQQPAPCARRPGVPDWRVCLPPDPTSPGRGARHHGPTRVRARRATARRASVRLHGGGSPMDPQGEVEAAIERGALLLDCVHRRTAEPHSSSRSLVLPRARSQKARRRSAAARDSCASSSGIVDHDEQPPRARPGARARRARRRPIGAGTHFEVAQIDASAPTWRRAAGIAAARGRPAPCGPPSLAERTRSSAAAALVATPTASGSPPWPSHHALDAPQPASTTNTPACTYIDATVLYARPTGAKAPPARADDRDGSTDGAALATEGLL